MSFSLLRPDDTARIPPLVGDVEEDVGAGAADHGSGVVADHADVDAGADAAQARADRAVDGRIGRPAHAE